MTAQPGDNSGITPEREKLFFYHRRKYLRALAAKKAADAAMKNCGKSIKADLGEFGLDELKDYETAQTPEGQEKLKLKSESTLRALRMAGMPVGTQLDIFTDRAPIDERAAQAGREAGMRGDTLSNPYNEASEEGQAFAAAWHEGQKAIFDIEKLKDVEAGGDELIKGDIELVRIEATPKKRGRPPKVRNGSDMDTATIAADAAKAAAEADAAGSSVSQ